MAKKREMRNTILVTIPNPKDLGVPLPDWFPHNKGSRNLIDAFNNVSDVPLEDMPEYENYVTDDELDGSAKDGKHLTEYQDEYMDEELGMCHSTSINTHSDMLALNC
ncbi:uncharacterized protein LOC141711260 [Apium graveolens]|uniref:uncharacterized protein LOC141711260 n=1 Tax=Apium graveolens TaxID=4045 RepID=UPI003D7B3B97